jgi:hypothetical protein
VSPPYRDDILGGEVHAAVLEIARILGYSPRCAEDLAKRAAEAVIEGRERWRRLGGPGHVPPS